MKIQNKTVSICDQIMGSGKTHNAIEKMKKSKKSFIYVTPFLTEVERILDNVPNTCDPKVTYSYDNKSEEYVTHYKRDNLLRMANQGLNLVTTHSLFTKLHKNDYKYFEKYDLILDEVLTPVKVLGMKLDDIKIAFNEGLLVLNEKTNEVSFTGDDYKGKFYSDLKQYCDTANVIFVNDRILAWAFPPEIFTSFNSVTVLTYLFEGSLLSNYFEYYNISYSVVKKSEEEEAYIKANINKLLSIYEGSCNIMGESPTAFSVNWMKKRNSQQFKRIKNTVANLVERKFKTTSANTGFTTFKEFESKLKGKGYSKGFIPVNERATNKYSNKETMIYLANRYQNPNVIDFFRYGSVTFDEDSWALSELLQWIWRGAIRQNKPMHLFIPCKRMRTLLYNWLEDYDELVLAA